MFLYNCFKHFSFIVLQPLRTLFNTLSILSATVLCFRLKHLLHIVSECLFQFSEENTMFLSVFNSYMLCKHFYPTKKEGSSSHPLSSILFFIFYQKTNAFYWLLHSMQLLFPVIVVVIVQFPYLCQEEQ